MRKFLPTVVLTVGCYGGTEPLPSGVEVDALISSVSLADDCAEMAFEGDGDAAPCFAPPCDYGGFCQQSSAQLDFTVGDGSEIPLTFEILEARLLDAATEEVIDDLETRAPTAWRENSYSTWDELLASPSEMNVSYKLSAPDWSSISSRSASDLIDDSEGDMFILELDVEIDGVLRTLRSEPVSREPEIVT